MFEVYNERRYFYWKLCMSYKKGNIGCNEDYVRDMLAPAANQNRSWKLLVLESESARSGNFDTAGVRVKNVYFASAVVRVRSANVSLRL